MNGINFRSWLISQLRRISYKWPARSEAFKNARIARNTYICAKCGDQFPRREVHCHHIKSVIDPKQGFITWDTFIVRLFCDVKGLQILCHECHRIKTKRENRRR